MYNSNPCEPHITYVPSPDTGTYVTSVWSCMHMCARTRTREICTVASEVLKIIGLECE